MGMRAASSHGVGAASVEAAEAAAAALRGRLPGGPDLLFAYADGDTDLAAVGRVLAAAFPGTPFVGGTSCRGVMTQEGFHGGTGPRSVGLFGLVDPAGAYGTALLPLDGDPRRAAAAAIDLALERSGRPWEAPNLVWICGAPGFEETVLAGIADVVGPNIPVFGGSSADNRVAGDWHQFDQSGCLADGLAVAVLFAGGRLGTAFQGGYEPTGVCGQVTTAGGRILTQIDGRSAATVYDSWTDGLVTGAGGAGASILARSTWTPLGRVVGDVEGVPVFLLIHPSRVTEDGTGLSLFAELPAGETVHLMRGTESSLVSRIGRVAQEALDTSDLAPDGVVGALAIYCGGCMMAVEPRMEDVVAAVTAVLPGIPFLGAFTFGEQGRSVARVNQHGNLMISVVVFGA